MIESRKKAVICCAVFVEILVLGLGWATGAKDLLVLLIIAPVGCHFVYGYLFNTDIYLGGYTVDAGKGAEARVLLLIFGLILIGVCIYFAAIGGGTVVSLRKM